LVGAPRRFIRKAPAAHMVIRREARRIDPGVRRAPSTNARSPSSRCQASRRRRQRECQRRVTARAPAEVGFDVRESSSDPESACHAKARCRNFAELPATELARLRAGWQGEHHTASTPRTRTRMQLPPGRRRQRGRAICVNGMRRGQAGRSPALPARIAQHSKPGREQNTHVTWLLLPLLTPTILPVINVHREVRCGGQCRR
jgi:hypothetical protein